MDSEVQVKINALHYLTNWEQLVDLSEIELKKLYSQIVFFENKQTDTQGFGINLYNKVIMVFRGTEPKLRDWLTDVNAFQHVIPYNNEESKIRVHKGVMEAYRSIRDQVHKFIKKIDTTDLIIIGHSLGGGLATLCAVDMQYNFNSNFNRIKCFTYGSLKIGNKAFCDSYNKRVPETYRIYLRTDIIPFLPPNIASPLVGKFEHVKKGIAIGPWDIFIGIKNLLKKWDKRPSVDLANHSYTLYKNYLIS